MMRVGVAIAGLSAIIVKSAFLFSLFRYAGSAYLIYLGIKNLLALRHQKPEEESPERIEEKFNSQCCFKQGFFTNLLNLNVAIFFLTFLPQFVDPGKAAFLSFLVLGITYCLLKAAWYISYVYMLDAISSFMKKPRIRAVFEGVISTVLIGFGVKLALEMKR